MKPLPQDTVPHDLESAIAVVKGVMEPSDMAHIKEAHSSDFLVGQVHFGLGMAVRNNFGCWERGTPLHNWFLENLQIAHGDDLSGIILDCAFRDLRGEPRRERELAEQYRQHWLRNGIDPATGQKLPAR